MILMQVKPIVLNIFDVFKSSNLYRLKGSYAGI
jgi:hypothetical protein